MGKGASDPEANRLLALLPVKGYHRLHRGLTAVALAAHQVLYETGQVIDHVYFLKKGCVVSLVLDLDDDRSCKAGLLGCEGLVGAEVFQGGSTARLTARVLAGGEALRVDAELFRAVVRDGGPLNHLLHRFVQYLLLQFAQLAGCNRFHSLEQHFCSLLLRLRNQSGRDELEITHEVFAGLVGVRRVGITQVAQKLQKDGLIRYRWGKVALLDRKGLEGRACVCHRQIQQAGRDLLGDC